MKINILKTILFIYYMVIKTFPATIPINLKHSAE